MHSLDSSRTLSVKRIYRYRTIPCWSLLFPNRTSGGVSLPGGKQTHSRTALEEVKQLDADQKREYGEKYAAYENIGVEFREAATERLPLLFTETAPRAFNLLRL